MRILRESYENPMRILAFKNVVFLLRHHWLIEDQDWENSKASSPRQAKNIKEKEQTRVYAARVPNRWWDNQPGLKDIANEHQEHVVQLTTLAARDLFLEHFVFCTPRRWPLRILFVKQESRWQAVKISNIVRRLHKRSISGIIEDETYHSEISPAFDHNETTNDDQNSSGLWMTADLGNSESKNQQHRSEILQEFAQIKLQRWLKFFEWPIICPVYNKGDRTNYWWSDTKYSARS